ncbi:astacin [Teladorsagia circumcincta]|uniref:Metalloendopeptidase n=1 Tax=Teladorsagia circumcincta TaxID=45464 RepID=A0A2G9U7D5_TELCI|nr:astacin [Teladorsagia circumcincta]
MDDTCINFTEHQEWRKKGDPIPRWDCCARNRSCSGFFRTQARYDRDDYIKVNKDNVKTGWTSDFDKQAEALNNNYGLPYDYGSIMHYGSKR